MSYVSLHNYTHFSFMQALPDPKSLLQKAKDFGHSAIAITDTANLIATWDAYKEAKKIGIKYIPGCEFYFVNDFSKEDERLKTFILLAKNHTGYKNLLLLHKLANDHLLIGSRKNYPRIDWKILEQHTEGLICLTGDCSGIVGQPICTRQIDEAKSIIQRLHLLFKDNLGLEVQPSNQTRIANVYSDYQDQRLVNNQLIKLSKELNIKIVPTTGCRYLEKEDHEAHDVACAIGAGQQVKSGNRPKFSNDFYFKSEEEVRSYFARLYPKDVDEWLANTVYFADQCENPDWVDPKFTNPSGKELPEFPVKDQPDYEEFLKWKENPNHSQITNEEANVIRALKEDAAYYRYAIYQNFDKKTPKGKEQEYHKRILDELEVLEYRDFTSYMLVVRDFIEWSKSKGIPVNYGRGSVGGALDAYYTDIHQIDSIGFDLVFARFQNKEKKSSPDVDTDFAQYGKPLVESYIRNKYGEDKVAKISNYLTLSPKQYVKAMSRAFQFGTDIKDSIVIGQKLSDLIPIDTSGKNYNDVDECIEKIPILAEWCKKYPEIEKYAKLLQNKPMALAKHAAGIVIGKRPLVSIVPLRRDEEGDLILEYEKERAEECGLIKIDLLGLSTLDIIQSTHRLLEKRGKQVPKINFNEYDKKTYDLISSGNTMCVFQFGTSGGTIDLCRKIKPKSIEDLSIITTLARPHAKNIREAFVQTRDGKKKFKPFHKCLIRAFEKTLGFPLYEESLLVLVQDAAKWDLHKADGLRKMTKDKGKHPEKEKQLRIDFIEDAQKQGGLSEAMANKIWDDVIQNYAMYSFNHSHAALYSMTSYETAYLKAHYPIEFLTANLIFESNANSPAAEDNKLKIKDELRAMGVKIIPPDINQSESTYKIIDDSTIMAGFDSLKYMGKDAMPDIIAKRPYSSFEDFLFKIDHKLVRSPAIAALAASGALDSFGLTRKLMFLYASDFKKKIALHKKKTTESEFKYPWPENIGEWTIPEKHAMEKYYLGEGLSGTIPELYPGFFDNRWIVFSKLKELFPKEKTKGDQYIDSSIGNLQGVIKTIFEFQVKKEGSKLKGQTMARLTVEDLDKNIINVTLFPDKLTEVKERIKMIYGTKIKFEPWIGIHFNAYANWYEGDIVLSLDGIKKCSPAPQKPSKEELEGKSVKMKIAGVRKSKMKQTSFDFGNEEKIEDIVDEIEEYCSENGINLDQDINVIDLEDY